jgi:hypothetical protein
MKTMQMRNDYDFTKVMLKTLRSLNESKSGKSAMNEQVGLTGPSQEQRNSDSVAPQSFNKSDEDVYDKVNDDITVINDVDIKLLSSDDSDLKLTEDQEKSISGLIDNFRQQVSQIVDLDPGFTINMDQIRLDGTLTDDDISFVLIAGQESGTYVNADMLKIEDETMVTLGKLLKFEETFKSTMEPLITQRNNNI